MKDIADRRNMLMELMAKDGVTADEYAAFLNEFNRRNAKKLFSHKCADGFDYNPMPDADEKTLKLKIQLRDVTKPPMWREVLVPAEFNFSQLHYIIQAAVGLGNCHLWQFERKPYEGGIAIGIPRTDPFSFGIENCTHHADETPLTAFLAGKGDKLVYVYDMRCDWIFNITVMDVLDRVGEVAECRKYKSDLQAFDDYYPYLYEPLRYFLEDPKSLSKNEVAELMREFDFESRDMLHAFADDRLIDIEFVNEELAEIPDEWEPID